MKKFIAVLAVFTIFAIQGCSSSKTEDMVDLDKVLDIMMKTMDSLEGKAEEKTVEVVEGDDKKTIKAVEAKAGQDILFLETFEKNLNDAKLISDPITTSLEKDGSIVGTNSKTNSKLFSVEVDGTRNRLIATDTQSSYRRDTHYHGGGGGLFMGYMLGSMMGRQHSYGVMPSRFERMKMNKKGYYKSAKSSSSARSKGSSSFKGGK
jgi:hypothetical protein